MIGAPEYADGLESVAEQRRRREIQDAVACAKRCEQCDKLRPLEMFEDGVCIFDDCEPCRADLDIIRTGRLGRRPTLIGGMTATCRRARHAYKRNGCRTIECQCDCHLAQRRALEKAG